MQKLCQPCFSFIHYEIANVISFSCPNDASFSWFIETRVLGKDSLKSVNPMTANHWIFVATMVACLSNCAQRKAV